MRLQECTRTLYSMNLIPISARTHGYGTGSWLFGLFLAALDGEHGSGSAVTKYLVRGPEMVRPDQNSVIFGPAPSYVVLPAHALQRANLNSSQRRCRLESKRTISLTKHAFISWKATLMAVAAMLSGLSGGRRQRSLREAGSILQEG